jgi:hypothetical protein
VDVLLVLLLSDEVDLVLGQSSSDSTGLLVTKVEGHDYSVSFKGSTLVLRSNRI